MQIDIPPALFAIFFLALWLLIGWLIAVMGGWTSLAGLYAAPDGFQLDSAQLFRFRSIQLRRTPLLPANYGNIMTIGVTDGGLYLAPFLLFRFRHDPLLIPWREITDCNGGSFLWVRWVDMTLRTGMVIRLYGGLAEDVWGEWRSRTRK